MVRSSYIVRTMPSMARSGFKRPSDPHQRIQKFGNAFERQILALDGNEHRIGRSEGIEGEKIKAGGQSMMIYS